MKLLTFEAAGHVRYGLHLADGVIDLFSMQRFLAARGALQAQAPLPSTLLGLIRTEAAGMDLAQRILDLALDLQEREGGEALAQAGVYFPLSEIAWRPPIPHQNRIFSLRGNNPILLRLDDLPLPQHPFVSPRYHGRLIGHDEPMVLRPIDREIGWGAEFTVVLGRGGKNISEAEAGKHILGYTAINDMNGGVFQTIAPELPPVVHVHAGLAASEKINPSGAMHQVPEIEHTARDDHYAGKFYGTWSMPQPIGPWIVTADEIADPYDLVVQSRESSIPCDTVTTAAMLLRFEDVIVFLSRFMTLKVGDMLTSGALGWHTIPGRSHYPPGASFEVEIEKIGVLRNPIIDQRHEANG